MPACAANSDAAMSAPSSRANLQIVEDPRSDRRLPEERSEVASPFAEQGASTVNPEGLPSDFSEVAALPWMTSAALRAPRLDLLMPSQNIVNAVRSAPLGPQIHRPLPLVIPGGLGDDSETIVDANVINGVGQMVAFFPDGSGASCTGSLINPRMVIFAAHCINQNHDGTEYVDSSIYGISHGGVPISFSFNSNNRDAVRHWAGRDGNTETQWQTDIDRNIFNSNYVTYHPDVKVSIQSPGVEGDEATEIILNAQQADVAMAVLDTPAARIPTWTLLFSPLKETTHILTTGYGLHGDPVSGMDRESSIDYRRRSAENMIAAYFSPSVGANQAFAFPGLDPEIDAILPGLVEGGWTFANVYWVSFSDPNYGKEGAKTYFDTLGLPAPDSLTQYDFLDNNPFDEEIVTAHEGSAAPGDSGGPMIVDQKFDRPVIAGVLSAGMPFSIPNTTNAIFEKGYFSYGWGYYYQPLALYWDWIAANNSYRYASAQEGNGKWTDPDHWRLNIDPNYAIEGPDGKLVNALPAQAAAGAVDTQDYWGRLCDFKDYCADTAEVRRLVQGGMNVQDAFDSIATPRKTSYSPYTGEIGEASLRLDISSAIGSDPTARIRVAALLKLERTDVAAVLDGIREASALQLIELATTVSPARSPHTTLMPLEIESLDASSNQSDTSSNRLLSSAPTSPVPAPAVRPLPAPTFENGLPGATGFVPMNDDGDATSGRAPRYFDITLSAAGRTSLDIETTIDRLTISGFKSVLDIEKTGALRTLIDTTVAGGNLNIDGRFESVGDLSVLAGVLSGRGKIKAPFVTSVMGVVSPGKIGEIATLEIEGSYIQSSGAILSMDLGENGTSDRLLVRANIAGGTAGDVNLGGALILTPANGAAVRYGNAYNLIQAEGQIAGTFDQVGPLPGVLRPVVSYSGDTVRVTINAASYFTEIDADNPLQHAFATLLDADRTHFDRLTDLFADLDIVDSSIAGTVLERMGPFALQSRVPTFRMQSEALAQIRRERMTRASFDQDAGRLVIEGQPLQLAGAALNPHDITLSPNALAESRQATSSEIKLPENMSAFVVGGYLDGRSEGLLTSLSPRATKTDGWYLSTGIEVGLEPSAFVGASLSYSQGKANAIGGEHQGYLVEGAFYGQVAMPGGFLINAQASVGQYLAKTDRTVALLTQQYNLQSRKTGLTYSVEAAVVRPISVEGLSIQPNARIRVAGLDLGRTREIGGQAALVASQTSFADIQGRAGLDFAGEFASGALQVRPLLTATFVHNFKPVSSDLVAGFAAGAATANFLSGSRDRNWVEMSGGVRIGSPRLSLDLAVDTTVGRSDLRRTTYRGSVTFRF